MLRDTSRSSKPEYRARYPDARPFHATRNPGAGEDFTDLAAVVQLHLRVAIGLQTLTVKSRLLPGENTVRIRGDPPVSNAPVAQLPERDASNVGDEGESPSGSANLNGHAVQPE